MKNKLYLLAFLSLFLVSFVLGATPSYEENYTVLATSSSNFQVSKLRYEPYPVTPGSYFTIYFQVEKKGSESSDVSFELKREFPFTMDVEEDSTISFNKLNSETLVLEYKVRVSDDAVSGDNPLTLIQQNKDGSSIEYEFNVYVYDVQTAFDAVIQESSEGELSIALANIGKNDALSTIVKIPTQDDITVSTTNAQMIGNLEQGDYTVVGFTFSKLKADVLTLQIDYTDAIGERRSELLDIDLVSGETNIQSNETQFQQNASADFRQQQESSSIMTYVIYLLLFLIIGVVIFWMYKHHKKKAKKNSGNKPEWMKK